MAPHGSYVKKQEKDNYGMNIIVYHINTPRWKICYKIST